MTKQLFIISLVLLGLVQFSFGQNRQQLVSELVKSTSEIFPYQQFEGGIKMKKILVAAELENGADELLIKKINARKDLTAAQKRRLKAKSEQFVEEYTNYVDSLISKDFKVKNWVNQYATGHFSQKFSTVELKNINAFLKTPSGQKALVTMRTAFAQGVSFNINNDANFADEKKFDKETQKFFDSALGTKFFNVLMENIIMDVAGRLDIWQKQVAKDFDKFLNEKEFNARVGKFIKQSKDA